MPLNPLYKLSNHPTWPQQYHKKVQTMLEFQSNTVHANQVRRNLMYYYFWSNLINPSLYCWHQWSGKFDNIPSPCWGNNIKFQKYKQ